MSEAKLAFGFVLWGLMIERLRQGEQGANEELNHYIAQTLEQTKHLGIFYIKTSVSLLLA